MTMKAAYIIVILQRAQVKQQQVIQFNTLARLHYCVTDFTLAIKPWGSSNQLHSNQQMQLPINSLVKGQRHWQ